MTTLGRPWRPGRSCWGLLAVLAAAAGCGDDSLDDSSYRVEMVKGGGPGGASVWPGCAAGALGAPPSQGSSMPAVLLRGTCSRSNSEGNRDRGLPQSQCRQGCAWLGRLSRADLSTQGSRGSSYSRIYVYRVSYAYFAARR